MVRTHGTLQRLNPHHAARVAVQSAVGRKAAVLALANKMRKIINSHELAFHVEDALEDECKRLRKLSQRSPAESCRLSRSVVDTLKTRAQVEIAQVVATSMSGDGVGPGMLKKLLFEKKQIEDLLASDPASH